MSASSSNTFLGIKTTLNVFSQSTESGGITRLRSTPSFGELHSTLQLVRSHLRSIRRWYNTLVRQGPWSFYWFIVWTSCEVKYVHVNRTNLTYYVRRIVSLSGSRPNKRHFSWSSEPKHGWTVFVNQWLKGQTFSVNEPNNNVLSKLRIHVNPPGGYSLI